jgi:hypothetical protein
MSKNQDNKDILKNLEEALNQQKSKSKPILKNDKTLQKDLKKKKLSQALRANLTRRKTD